MQRCRKISELGGEAGATSWRCSVAVHEDGAGEFGGAAARAIPACFGCAHEVCQQERAEWGGNRDALGSWDVDRGPRGGVHLECQAFSLLHFPHLLQGPLLISPVQPHLNWSKTHRGHGVTTRRADQSHHGRSVLEVRANQFEFLQPVGFSKSSTHTLPDTVP